MKRTANGGDNFFFIGALNEIEFKQRMIIYAINDFPKTGVSRFTLLL